MYLRNLMAMDTEEMLKSLPVDAVASWGDKLFLLK